MKLIDKDALVEKIWQRRMEHFNFGGSPASEYCHEDDEIFSIINTIEVKEVDLEKHRKENNGMDYKVEGDIFYRGNENLTWGPFYYHSKDKAIVKGEKTLQDITEWCNLKDPSLQIKPQNVKRLYKGEQIIFEILAWKDDDNLENCDGIITVEEIYFED